MAEQWTGDIVASLHIHQITRRELADEIGITPQYVTMVLNGKKKCPTDMQQRMKDAIAAIVARSTN